jgi:endoglucanase
MKNFLRVSKGRIVDQEGSPVFLRGVNLGGWLMMEGYLLCGRNIPEQTFKSQFTRRLGPAALADFEQTFRRTFVQELDLAQIAQWGFNCIRVPFHYRIVEGEPFEFKNPNIAFLDRLVKWAKKYHLKVILDLHAACGAQNHDWHSDSIGPADLWQKETFRQRTCALWAFIADRYRSQDCIAGFDLLNEATVDTSSLNAFYRDVIKAIRQVNRNHILFIEGHNWSTDIKGLDAFEDDNYVLSLHMYEPVDFTFNFIPHVTYPIQTPLHCLSYEGKKKRIVCHHGTMERMIAMYAHEAQKRAVPLLVGEFGINYRAGFFGEDLWVENMVSLFKTYQFHWTYWTYKSMKKYTLPDGLMCYYGNPPWINRLGPLSGWETYIQYWPKDEARIKNSWKTREYQTHRKIVEVLQKYAR